MDMKSSERAAHRANRLLAAMRSDDLSRLLPHLQIVEFAPRTILVEPGEKIRRVYFPHSAVICLMAVMEESGIAETATIGPEGMAGFEVLLGRDTAMNRMLVQVSGSASAVSVRELRAVAGESLAFRTLLLRYIGGFLVQVTQSVACNSLHRLDERCCRWLLMAHDRAGRDSFSLTQEFLAEMLGVHRPTVTIVARTLQAAGLIRYSRGKLTIVDRKGLEDATCECYAITRKAYDDIFS
jgi:CRP-like cAMP-binding protein